MPVSAPAIRQAPREVPPEQALPEPTIGVSGVVGGGLTAVPVATAAGTAAGVAATRAGLPVIKAVTESLEGILQGLFRFFVLQRSRQEAWLVSRARIRRLPMQDILDLVAEESSRQAEFQRRVFERVRRDAGKALGLPVEQREKAVAAVLRREKVYARQRAEAMAVRALSAIDRVVLRREGPAGAFWELDADAATHTAGCRILAGYVFPWEILDVTHPPFGHAGCRCRLRAPREGEPPIGLARARALVARALAAEAAEHGH